MGCGTAVFKPCLMQHLFQRGNFEHPQPPPASVVDDPTKSQETGRTRGHSDDSQGLADFSVRPISRKARTVSANRWSEPLQMAASNVSFPKGRASTCSLHV
jgi:hypothetical protein